MTVSSDMQPMPADYRPFMETKPDGRTFGSEWVLFSDGRSAWTMLGFHPQPTPHAHRQALNVLRMSLWQAREAARLGKPGAARLTIG